MTVSLPPELAQQTAGTDTLRTALAAQHDFFLPERPCWAARAPGRLDLMGGFADYSGSRVLQMPTAEATWCVVQRDPAAALRVASLEATTEAGAPDAEFPMADLLPGGEPMDYLAARTYFTARPAERWAAYPLGALLVLLQEEQVPLDGGLRLLFASNVPLSTGLSSSAAIEVAAMRATAGALGVTLDGRTLALYCQMAENLVAGAPCGVMDQLTSACATRHHLLSIRCQPAEIEGQVRIPDGVGIWAVDSGIRHAVSGADYDAVRVGTFMGWRILAARTGACASRGSRPDLVHLMNPPWHGYLANLTPSEYMVRFREDLPLTMQGDAFLATYAGTTDAVTRVDPDRTYPVRRPVEHAVYENQRVALVQALLGQPAVCDTTLELVGELMYQAHASYTACGAGSQGTDRLAALAQQAGPDHGIYGAKITGGGSGGCVAILGRREAEPAVRRIATRYREETGIGGVVFDGTSEGAMAFGVHQLENT
ncbi:MAG: galactokinase [Candidatus Hydrogenedentota bacterium]